MLYLRHAGKRDTGHTVGEDHRLDGGPAEGRAAHCFQSIRQLDLRQTGAVVEGIAADARHTYRDTDLRQGGAVVEGIAADARQTYRDTDLRQGGAVLEGIAVDGGHTRRDVDLRQGSTIPEGRISDVGQRAGQLHGLQILKALESAGIARAALDLRHALAQLHRLQGGQARKLAGADGGDAARPVQVLHLF